MKYTDKVFEDKTVERYHGGLGQNAEAFFEDVRRNPPRRG